MNTDKKSLKLLITGGHASATAYALMSYIRNSGRKWDLYWVGPKSFIEGQKVTGLEENAFEKLGVKQNFITAGRLQRRFTRYTIPSLLKIPVGILQAVRLISEVRPDVVLSFGGFVGFPVVLASKLFGIPVLIHEQTTAAGRANVISSKFADMVALARSESIKYFPGKKTVLTGNPVDESILNISRKKVIGNPPQILVTGGHTGSVFINRLISENLESLLSEFKVVHQTGKIDFEKMTKIRNNLEPKLRKNYEVYQTIDPQIWPSELQKSDIIVSRAGANTVAQILITKRPSILIPIPFSYLNEQYSNAKAAEEFGIATVLEEKDASSERFLELLRETKKNWRKYIENSSANTSPDINASETIVLLIEKLAVKSK